MENRILILGANGFLGNALYKELLPYFDVYGTYFSTNAFFEQNQVFFHYDAEKDDVEFILNEVRPHIIISALRGNHSALYALHQQLFTYVSVTPFCKLIFLSSVRVFDGIKKFPAYENNKTLASTSSGKHKIAIEKLISTLSSKKYTILRLPMVLGVNSPSIISLKESIKNKCRFEVFPNLVLNTTTDTKLSQQIHYIINQNRFGVFHLGSTDLIHHSDLFLEIAEKLGGNLPIFTNTFTSNKDLFLAVLSKENQLPSQHQITVNEVINEVTCNDSLTTLKEKLI